MREAILIASSVIDEPTYLPVKKLLEKKGYLVVIYQTEQALSGELHFSVSLEANGKFTMKIDDTPINYVKAAWYRKIGSFLPPYIDTPIAKHLYIHNEVRAFHDTIWALLPENVWLNSPRKLANAERKITQLMIAHEIGFHIPETIISSDWSYILTHLLKGAESNIIIKMIHGIISDGTTLKAMYTKAVDRQEVAGLTEYTSPFPGIYQPYIEKAREWRITVVGNNVFSAAIYTAENAKDDWRKLQSTEAVKFYKEKPPKGIEDLCIQYLARMGLRFGAFDFIEKPDGEIVFLECNPNGQYSWLEEELIGFPISIAIANELILIAENSAD